MPSRAEVEYIVEKDQHNGLSLAAGQVFGGTLTRGGAVVHKDRFDIGSGTITMTNNGTSCNGSLILGAFPAENILLLGGAGSLTVTAPAANASTVTATAALVIGVGTVAGAAATLTTTTANLIQSTAFTLAASTKSGALKSTVTPTAIDSTTNNSTVPANIYLNIAMANTNGAATTTVVISGFVKVAWAALGNV